MLTRPSSVHSIFSSAHPIIPFLSTLSDPCFLSSGKWILHFLPSCVSLSPFRSYWKVSHEPFLTFCSFFSPLPVSAIFIVSIPKSPHSAICDENDWNWDTKTSSQSLSMTVNFLFLWLCLEHKNPLMVRFKKHTEHQTRCGHEVQVVACLHVCLLKNSC